MVSNSGGLLVQGKSDFDAIANLRGDKLFKQALGVGFLPSSPTLRQRMDAGAVALGALVPAMIERLLVRSAPDYGVLPCGWLPLDIDTFAMDNSGTSKEGVGRTYAGVDGYCPLAAYLGSHGFCLELSLRPGAQHSATNRWAPPSRRRQGRARRDGCLLRLCGAYAAVARGLVGKAPRRSWLDSKGRRRVWTPRDNSAPGRCMLRHEVREGARRMTRQGLHVGTQAGRPALPVDVRKAAV